ncbi:DUF1599 domain-containing protein [Candidatus Roizmanbacteria bacterium]|nr:DUF1599 domain-containing protein [Candidatus Roizmanbacteria bacterium]
MADQPRHLDEAFEQVCNEIADLFIKKHHDYGKENVLEMEELGIAFRTSEKIARLKNLLKEGKAPENESLEETWKDIAVYAIIAVLYRRHWFQDLEVKK